MMNQTKDILCCINVLLCRVHQTKTFIFIEPYLCNLDVIYWLLFFLKKNGYQHLMYWADTYLGFG